MYGNGWPGSTARGGQHGKHARLVDAIEFGTFVEGCVLPRNDLDTGSAQLGNEAIDERLVEALDHARHPLRDRGELLRGSPADVGRSMPAII